MELFKEHAVAPELFMLTSGVVSVEKFSWTYQRWTGEAIKDTYNGKPVLNSERGPVFAELAVVSILKAHGFEVALWVDSYRKCSRDAMPPAVCTPPVQIREVYDRIATANGSKWGGCWDVIAWDGKSVAFVECKRKGKDRILPSQVKWLESALKVGLRLENFMICEWNSA